MLTDDHGATKGAIIPILFITGQRSSSAAKFRMRGVTVYQAYSSVVRDIDEYLVR